MRHKRIGYRARLRLQRVVFERDKYRCRHCGSPGGRRGRLEGHHVRPFGDGGDDSPENMLTLCLTCHVEHHRQPDPARAAWRKFLRQSVLTSKDENTSEAQTRPSETAWRSKDLDAIPAKASGRVSQGDG